MRPRYDCGKFVRLWHELDGVRFGGRRHLGAGEGPEGVLVEVGANIGACTLELLLRTKARIIAFEPSPSNLFYLTRTLQLAAQRDPAIAERVVVYPIGVGDAPSRLPLFTQRGNLGNTVVGQALSDDCVGRRAGAECLNRTMAAGAKGEVTVLPLDTVFPLGMGGVRLVKLDVQGFECHVLQGASHALARAVPPVGVVAAEVAPTWLYGQCCRPSFLVHLLSRIGSGGGGLVDGSGSGGGIVASGGSHHGYNVTCTKRVGPDYTCLGRPPHGTSLANANELHETPPTPTHLATLRRKMATCERRRKARVVR